MSHEVETMAYAHEVPWHGLGNRVEGNATIEEMLVAAGLDWEVQQHPMFIEVDGVQIPTRRSALIRATDKKILTISGPNWKPVQNRQAMELFREYTDAAGVTLETAGSLRGGKIIWALARVAAGFSLNGRDHVKAYILLVWTHEVGHANTARFTSVRVVCANTLAMAGGVRGAGAEYRQTHQQEFNILKAREAVQLVKEQMATMQLEAEALQ